MIKYSSWEDDMIMRGVSAETASRVAGRPLQDIEERRIYLKTQEKRKKERRRVRIVTRKPLEPKPIYRKCLGSCRAVFRVAHKNNYICSRCTRDNKRVSSVIV